MTQSSRRPAAGIITVVLLACAVVFIWLSGRVLPDSVASHFAASGLATGFLPRARYLQLTLMLVVALPLGINGVASLGVRSARVHLPNPDYWLAPERRPASVDFVRRHVARLGLMLIVFFCYVHWLVVRANALTPPALSSGWFIGGLCAFMLSVAIWSAIFLRRFRVSGNG